MFFSHKKLGLQKKNTQKVFSFFVKKHDLKKTFFFTSLGEFKLTELFFSIIELIYVILMQ